MTCFVLMRLKSSDFLLTLQQWTAVKLTIDVFVLSESYLCEFYSLSNYAVLISLTYANFGQALQKLRWSTNPSWCISVAFV